MCAAAIVGLPARKHSQECRDRLESLVEQMGAGRRRLVEQCLRCEHTGAPRDGDTGMDELEDAPATPAERRISRGRAAEDGAETRRAAFDGGRPAKARLPSPRGAVRPGKRDGADRRAAAQARVPCRRGAVRFAESSSSQL